jgi:hypothetical protein
MTTLSRSVASLRLFGDDLMPEEISRLLGAKPTAYETKGGQSKPNARGRTFTARTGSWRLKVPDRIPGDLNGQIAELLAQLTCDLGVWRGLAARFRVDIFCGLFLNEGNEGIDLTPATLASLGERGILLDLDIYANQS